MGGTFSLSPDDRGESVGNNSDHDDDSDDQNEAGGQNLLDILKCSVFMINRLRCKATTMQVTPSCSSSVSVLSGSSLRAILVGRDSFPLEEFITAVDWKVEKNVTLIANEGYEKDYIDTNIC